MNPDEKKMIDEDDLDVDCSEYENFFFVKSEEEENLDLEVALAIDEIIKDINYYEN